MSDIQDRINARRAELAKQPDIKSRIAARRSELSGEVVYRTDNGGEVRKLPDGSLAYKDSGYATTDPEAISRIMGGETAGDQSAASFDRSTLAQAPTAARLGEFVQGFPLVGEYLDEATGAINPGKAESMRGLSGAMERQNPVESMALNVGGGVLGTIPAALAGGGAAAANFVGKAGSALGRVARAATLGGVSGAVEGAASFSGRDSENRIRGAAIGAGVGGGLGAFLAPVADLLGTGATGLAKRVKGLDVRTIAEEFGLSAPAARTVKEALINDDLAAASARISSLGDDAMLADAGPATQALLDASSKAGGKALAVTRDAVEGRASAMGKRLPGALDSILGGVKGIKAAARDIAERTAPARKAFYDRVYATAINYADDTGRAIEGVVSKVPSRALKAAIQEANDEMQSLGLKNMQILADIADDGTVKFRQMPNTRQLDELKKALDKIGREAVDQFGRPTAEGVRYRRLAGELRDALAEAVPAYRSALKLGGDKIRQDEALDLGKRLLWDSTTVEDVKSFIRNGMSDDMRAAARQGLRETIENTLGNVRRTITDPNTDAREAMKLVKDLSSRNNMAKLRFILGGDDAKKLIDELEKQATALILRGAVARNSDTAIRQSIQGSVRAEVAPGAVRRTLGNAGNPLEAARGITQTLAGTDARSINAAEREQFAEIAKALTSIRGPQAQAALAAVQKALSGQPLKDEEARLIGSAIAFLIPGPARQIAKLSLEGQ